MRHKKKFNHLGRKRGHRHAMLSNMASSLIMHKRIKTTTAKAKALKMFVEPLITKAKEDTTHSRREAFKHLQDKDATNELFREVAVKVGDRPGGYTRIIKIGHRLGDSADMCIIELVDYNENLLAEAAAAKKSSRRRRGGKKKSTAETDQAAVADAPEITAESSAETADGSQDEKPETEAAVEEPETELPVDKPEEKPEAEDKQQESKAEKEETETETQKQSEEPEAEEKNEVPKSENNK